MRRLLVVLAAGSLVAASGCCWGGPELGACVVDAGWGQARCEPIFVDEQDEVCVGVDPVAPVAPLPPPGECGGAFYGGRSCPEVGFTASCNGGYYVRPGNPC